MADVALIEIDQTVAQTIAMGHTAFEVHYNACLGEVDDPEDGRVWRWRCDARA